MNRGNNNNDGIESIPLNRNDNEEPTQFSVYFSELIGTLFFVFVAGCAVSVTGNIDSESMNCSRVLTVALIDGFLFYGIIFITMKISHGQSGYCNPALTFSLSLVDMYLDPARKRFHFSRFLQFFGVQMVGAVIGAGLVILAVPDTLSGIEKGGVVRPNIQETIIRAVILEIFLSAFLVLVVLSVRANEKRFSSLLLAFAYTCVRLLSFPLIGDSLNFARNFAHVVYSLSLSDWQYLWISLLSPAVGVLLGTSSFLFLHRGEI